MIILRFLLNIVIALLLIPLCWALTTPFILIGAAFRQEPYFVSVRKAYGKITNIVGEIGFLVIDV